MRVCCTLNDASDISQWIDHFCSHTNKIILQNIKMVSVSYLNIRGILLFHKVFSIICLFIKCLMLILLFSLNCLYLIGSSVFFKSFKCRKSLQKSVTPHSFCFMSVVSVAILSCSFCETVA